MMTHKTLSGVTEEEFGQFRDYLAVKTGLALRSEKKEELLELLSRRMAKLAPQMTFEHYFRVLQSEGDLGAELRALVARLTVGETHFFRNRPQFDALRNVVLPELIRKRRDKVKRLRFWSAGCSTGEEPYSLAMLLLELLPDIEDWSVVILATDINTESLATAKEGFYRNWSFREVDTYYQRRFFTEEEEGWRISPQVREMVTFRYLNLAEDVYPAGVTLTDSQDLIVCRNVMIYFNVDLSLEITGRFYRCLEDMGYLVVGHAEHSEMVYSRFRRKMFGSAILYSRAEDGEYWEKGIKLRFRGSGKEPADLVPHRAGGERKKKGVQRPADTEETVRFEEAVRLYQEMSFEGSLKLFRAILLLNPGNERARYMAALISANCGDIDEAEKDVSLILGNNPLHLEATYLQSLVCRIRGDDAGEVAALKKTIYLNRDFVLGHFQLGIFYLRDGREDDAQRSLANVLEILKERAEEDFVGGVDDLTVGKLRRAVTGMIPGGAPEGLRHE
jgi:chemotaxis protein methyltransferase CheR